MSNGAMDRLARMTAVLRFMWVHRAKLWKYRKAWRGFIAMYKLGCEHRRELEQTKPR